MRFLFALLLLVGCNDRQHVLIGRHGEGCYFNGTCDDGLICVRWKNANKSDQSVCADPTSLNVGGFLVPKSCQECSACPALHCPPLKAAECPLTCLPVPQGPCQECKACEPGWKRAK